MNYWFFNVTSKHFCIDAVSQKNDLSQDLHNILTLDIPCNKM